MIHCQFQYFWMYQKYWIIIGSKYWQNFLFDSDLSQKFNYVNGMKGPTLDIKSQNDRQSFIFTVTKNNIFLDPRSSRRRLQWLVCWESAHPVSRDVQPRNKYLDQGGRSSHSPKQVRATQVIRDPFSDLSPNVGYFISFITVCF